MSIVWCSTPPKVKEVKPEALLSAGAIVLNKDAAELLGKPDSVVIGYDVEEHVIVIAYAKSVKEPDVIKYTTKANKNGISIQCRKIMPAILEELSLTIDARQRIRCTVELTKDKMLLIHTGEK